MKINAYFMVSSILFAGCLAFIALNSSPVEANGKTKYECHYKHHKGELYCRSRPIVKAGLKRPWRVAGKLGCVIIQNAHLVNRV
jgi:hypothetical protein